MDSEQRIVVNFIRQHMPDACSDIKKLKAYLSDCLPEHRALKKVLCDAYEDDIHEIIGKATDPVLTMHKCKKKLEEDCGMDSWHAAWATETWACILGHEDWKCVEEKQPEIKVQPTPVAPTPLKPQPAPVRRPQPTPTPAPRYSGYGSGLGSSYHGYSSLFDDEEQKDNYLTIDDQIKLEDAGLDVDELANMDWSDRYDAIEGAGLDSSDFDYGFDD